MFDLINDRNATLKDCTDTNQAIIASSLAARIQPMLATVPHVRRRSVELATNYVKVTRPRRTRLKGQSTVCTGGFLTRSGTREYTKHGLAEHDHCPPHA